MDFIQYYNAVLGKQRICQDFSKQTSICHVLQHSVLPQTVGLVIPNRNYSVHFSCRTIVITHLWCAVIKSHLVSNLSAQSALHLLSDPLSYGDGSHTTRLGDSNLTVLTKTYSHREIKRVQLKKTKQLTKNITIKISTVHKVWSCSIT